MSLLKQHQQELIAMATSGVNDVTRRRLERLIASDEQCARYWQELLALTDTMACSQQAADTQPLPEGFHFNLRQALRSSKNAPQRDHQPLCWLSRNSWPSLLLRPAVALSIIAATLLLTKPFLKSPTMKEHGNEPPVTSSTPLTSTALAPHSWAALRVIQEAPTPLTKLPASEQASQGTPTMAWAGRNTLIDALDL